MLTRLVRSGVVVPVGVEGQKGEWYLLARDMALLESPLATDDGRAVLLSPFDNLICDRVRTRQLFGFDFTVEIYVPAARRRYGYYVLPIVYGDRLIGRLDLFFDRPTRTLRLNAVYAEPDAPTGAGPAVAAAVQQLADFLGATAISLGPTCPPKWCARPARPERRYNQSSRS